jgi:hypothetical protein
MEWEKMGKILAKLPQQRVRAGENHPTVIKLEKLFDYMDELKIELSFYGDRVFVIDQERPNDKDWEIRDVINNEFLIELPCYPKEYKLTQEVDISPREAQSALDVKNKVPRIIMPPPWKGKIINSKKPIVKLKQKNKS